MEGETLKLNLQCPINSLGYGQVGINIAKALYNRKVKTTLFPIGKPEINNGDDANIIQEQVNNIINGTYDSLSPTIKIYHQFALAEHVGRGKYFGWPIFELDTFSDLEKAHLNSCDELIVCSDWARLICRENNIECPITVVPLGYDPTIFYPHTTVGSIWTPNGYVKRNPGSFVFFNCGKWETRKGHDVLIEAFCSAFSTADNVELWMMTSNPFLTPEETKAWEDKYKRCKLWSKVKLLPRVKTHEEVANIMAEVDCGVFPARAEGWNLEALEILAMGKELIITNCTGHTAFADYNNSHLISMSRKEKAIGLPGTEAKWFFGQGNWWEFGSSQKEQLIHHMKNLYTNRISKNTNKLDKFTWDSVVGGLLAGEVYGRSN